MKLLSKYLLKNIIRPFIITLILTNGILLLGYSFQSLPLFLNNKPGFLVILEFLSLRIPQNILLTIPISGLVSVLSLGTRMITKGEFVLITSSGISKKSIILPVFSFFLLLSIISLVLSEVVVSQSNKAHKELKKRIKKEAITEKRILIKLKDGFLSGSLSLEGNIIKDLKFQRKDLIISAKFARYLDKKWYLSGGKMRKIKKQEVIGERPISILKAIPSYDEIRILSSDYPLMEPSLLFKAISIAKKYGMEYKMYLKELNFKIAFCFSSLILTMIGLGIIIRGLKFGLYGNIGIAFIISFIYWQGILFFQSFPLSPFLASWTPHIVGLSIAVKLLSK